MLLQIPGPWVGEGRQAAEVDNGLRRATDELDREMRRIF